jgi:hypothetical protein
VKEVFVLEIEVLFQHMLREAEENHNNQSEDRDVILWPPEYEAGILPFDRDLPSESIP